MAKDIFAQIRQMLEIAARSTSNINEAANAAAIAQELMLKHNITMAELEATGQAAPEEMTGEALEDSGGEQRRITWHGSLSVALCNAFDCKPVWIGSTLSIFGRTSNVQTVKYMFSYLLREIERLAVLARKHGQIAPGKTGSNSFKLGAVAAIRNRMAADKQKQMATYEVTNPNAMVIISREKEAVAKYVSEKMGGNLKSHKTTINTNRNSFQAGYNAGQGISLGGGKAIGAGPKLLGC